MSERTRSGQEIRIVPGAPNPPAAGTRTAPASAVQMFRSLAAQASSLAGAIAAQPDEPQKPPSYAPHPEAAGETSPLPDSSPAFSGRSPASQSAEHAEAAEPDGKTSASARRPSAIAPKGVDQNNPRSEEAALGEHIVRACTQAAHGEVLAQHLADRIARFCLMSGASDDASWEVTLPMNPVVLPDTLLHLELSPSRIAIRFETSSPRSAGLIYDNADMLRTGLSDALRRQIDIHVVA